MTGYLIVALVVLIFVVIFQIAKASEYVSILKGEKKAQEQNNRINAFLMVVFLVGGLVAAWWCNDILYKTTLLGMPSASEHGANIDRMLWITIVMTGIVFVITQVLLFWFAYRYQQSEKREAYYYPHNNKLELLWTVVPAIALTVLVGFGLYYWFQITGEPPAGKTMTVEITGHQFAWEYRYPGKDAQLGRVSYKLVDATKSNNLGQDWQDPANHDDLRPSEIRLIKGVPVQLVIRAQDVIHDVGLPHFRLKMDAVPGIPTTMWFTPQYTTEEMKRITNNSKFQYEIVCDQVCGSSHYSMKGLIVVDTREGYDKWLAEQKPAYQLLQQQQSNDPNNSQSGGKDSAAKATKIVEPKNLGVAQNLK